MTNQKLRELCIENNWFIWGSNEQYKKLFDYNYNGAFISQLAVMIRKLEEAEEEWQRVQEVCENEQ